VTGFISEKDRNIIPRWRSFRDSQTLNELHSSVKPPARHTNFTNDNLAQKIDDWKENQTGGKASDLIGTALAESKLYEATDAIEFLLKEDTKAAPLAKKLAARSKHFLEGKEDIASASFDKYELRKEAKYLKQLLHEEPKNPIQWVDLSRIYARLGQYKQSSHCMNLAVVLAPNSRFILRSAARLWVHVGENDRAYQVLARSGRTNHDPWLMAAEIAVGIVAEKKPKSVRKAKSVLATGKFSPAHISELASAVATLEWENSAGRNARKLFRQSLIEPTENSIAQAVWVSGKENLIGLNDDHLTRADANEAKARTFYFNEVWDQAVEQCKEWQQVEPFSTRPGRLGSYIASVVIENFREAHEIAEAALVANPGDPSLLNSSAYALINMGDYNRAEQKLREMPDSGKTLHSVLKAATTGLLCYRKNNIKEGNQLYNQAHSLAENMVGYDPGLPARVAAFHALEKYHHQPIQDSHQLVSDTIQDLKKHKTPSSDILIKKLNRLERQSP